MAGYESRKPESVSQINAARRGLLLTGTIAFIVLSLVSGIVLVARRHAASQTSFAALLAQTPLSGVLTADLCLVIAGAISTLLCLHHRQNVTPDAIAASNWLPGLLMAPLSLSALVLAGRATGTVVDMARFSHNALSVASGLSLLLAFIVLFQERALATTLRDSIPEVRGLVALLRSVVSTLAFAGFLTGCAAGGMMLPAWLWKIPCWLVVCAACELLARYVIRWFLPTGQAPTAVGNLLFDDPRVLHPAHIALLLKTQFGVDFERSWALSFVRQAFLPVTVTMVLLVWSFSGVVKIGQNQRGVYEFFGAPRAVLSPGLHLIAPRPFGYVRLTEFGTIRSIIIADTSDAAKTVTDSSTAEGEAPDSANHLWENSPDDASYLVARSNDGRAGFEILTVNLRILYRVRLSDQGVMDALYNVSSPDDLLRSLARHDLVTFFASETLDGVMATRRDKIAEIISMKLQQALDSRHSGIEVVAVLIDSVQPPAAAAKSWRAVQAAEVRARMSIAEERTRAAGTAALARRDAYTAQSFSLAEAETIRNTARADAARMTGDDKAWQAGGRAFLFEYYLAALKTNLRDAAITVVDSHIPRSLLDLRETQSGQLPPDDRMAPK
ncbi:SPFH domain-containing protein [Acetobacter sp.]|uniref:SPFH domain-containing protein n=1 Tax=Acetobacter sp. TaxID=440 RepID=UPI0025C0E9C3|nr:SPFH domain-containing protein [Acetobacter sp.]MCH4092012.1 hypothetical protein [Acetobacter sp.]MCI1300734.1 SPFH domain-containing protein [Acetobacter sp.]MCI1317514.1 SPFH domain-containing protein [Acetobacter sp.]